MRDGLLFAVPEGRYVMLQPDPRSTQSLPEISMKLMLASIMLISLSACVVAPEGGSGKAGGDTAVVCHKGKKTLELPRSAAQAHLNHGDRPGPC